MSKRLITVFGPKLGGKTTVSRELCEQMPDSETLECFKPETWLDPSWGQFLTALQRSPYDKEPQTRDKHVLQAYLAARVALRDVNTVVMDEDPCMHWLTNFAAEYGTQDATGSLHEALVAITDETLKVTPGRIALHVTVAGQTPEVRAGILAERAQIDYTSEQLADSAHRIAAADQVEQYLREANAPVFRINTNEPYDIAAITQGL